jgi:hypothetical protein
MTNHRRRERRFAVESLEGRAAPSGGFTVGTQTSSFVRGLNGCDCDINRGAINAGIAQALNTGSVNENVAARYTENALAYYACQC